MYKQCVRSLTCQLLSRNYAGWIRSSVSYDNMTSLILFDVDGTLTKPIQAIDPALEEFLLTQVKPKYAIGLVGGSDFKKIAYQMGGDNVVDKFDFVFAENGLIAYKRGNPLESQTIQKFMGEEKLQDLINFALEYMSKLRLPVKRGNFVEFRSGMINLSPVGRSCSQEERIQFSEYDKVHNVREKFVDALRLKFPDAGLQFSIGGQISIDVFPIGWDKTYCLGILEKESFAETHFFGDRTAPGGNDHEIFNDPRTIGHTVTSPEDTRKQLEILISD